MSPLYLMPLGGMKPPPPPLLIHTRRMFRPHHPFPLRPFPPFTTLPPTAPLHKTSIWLLRLHNSTVAQSFVSDTPFSDLDCPPAVFVQLSSSRPTPPCFPPSSHGGTPWIRSWPPTPSMQWRIHSSFPPSLGGGRPWTRSPPPTPSLRRRVQPGQIS